MTDPSKLKDPDRAKYPRDLVGDSLCPGLDVARWRRPRLHTGLGHSKEAYANPILYQHILGGILWAMERDPK